ncbi:MAG: hypothetical protein GX824_07130, partial [Clostridiales bacterium]|nr:hypothetical protein [Clostridiales bacterium]
MLKKALAIILTFLLLFSAMPVGVYAGSGNVVDESNSIRTTCAEYTPIQSQAEDNNKTIMSFSGTETGVNFYEQLENDSQRAIYNSFKSLTGTETTLLVDLPGDITFDATTYPLPAAEKAQFDALVQRNFMVAIEAFQKDCPEIFWLKFGAGGTVCSGRRLDIDENTFVISVIRLTFTLVTLEAYEGNVPAVRQQLEDAVANFPITGTSRYQIAQSIHDTLALTVTYDIYSDCANEATGALLYMTASSTGYSKAFKLICDYYDVPAVVVNGTRLTDYGRTVHYWNYILMEDGNWYAVDCAWDDQTNDTYLLIYYDFFLVGQTTYAIYLGGRMFSESHTPSGDFSGNGYKTFVYPALSLDCVDVDYTELTILLQLESEYPDEYYTPESIAAFNNAITAGLNVDPFLDKSQQWIIDAASDAILTVYHNLTLRYHIKQVEGSSTLFDRDGLLIAGLEEGLTQEALMTSYLELLGGATATVTACNSNGKLGTGSTVNIYVDDVLTETYTLLIYGDIDGDGYANACDALFADLLVSAAIEPSSFSDSSLAAADANHDGMVDSLDRELLMQAGI